MLMDALVALVEVAEEALREGREEQLAIIARACKIYLCSL